MADFIIKILLLIVAALVALFGIRMAGKDKQYDKKEIDELAQKRKKEAENELRKKSSDAIIDDLANKDAIRTTIDSGRNRFSDRIRNLLKGRSKKSGPADSSNSG